MLKIKCIGGPCDGQYHNDVGPVWHAIVPVVSKRRVLIAHSPLFTPIVQAYGTVEYSKMQFAIRERIVETFYVASDELDAYLKELCRTTKPPSRSESPAGRQSR